jgi:isopentenyl diphosphate isomerase/L-lactate dehydrogenase-like FMN-dependent dehydrogenase
MSGQDAYAAVAMGAKAVLIGRAYLYGLMAGGEAGVQRDISPPKRFKIYKPKICNSPSI